MMAHRRRAILCLIDEYEEETGMDAPKLPDEAYTTWCACQQGRWRRHHERRDDARIRMFLHEPPVNAMATWAPALLTFNPHPTVNVICFHSSGCAEDMYTGTGTGQRRAPNPLKVHTM